MAKRPAYNKPAYNKPAYNKEVFTMNITTQAAQAINMLVADHPDAGLRISARNPVTASSGLDLALSVVGSPAETDEKVEDNGAKVFLEDQVAPLLADKTLDVTNSGDTQKVLFQVIS
jgi:iron-sulfur cluster assembly protein